VIGVVKDFHYHSLHEPISPLVIINAKRFGSRSGLMALRVQGDNFKSSVASIGAFGKNL
jgi:putative ABC transport system permease protein